MTVGDSCPSCFESRLVTWAQVVVDLEGHWRTESSQADACKACGAAQVNTLGSVCCLSQEVGGQN